MPRSTVLGPPLFRGGGRLGRLGRLDLGDVDERVAAIDQRRLGAADDDTGPIGAHQPQPTTEGVREATEALVRHWATHCAPGYFEARGADRDAMLDGFARYGEMAASAATELFDWFLDDVARS